MAKVAKELTIKKVNAQMTITISENGNVNHSGSDDDGEVTNLMLVDTSQNPHKEYPIQSIPDDVIIDTQGSSCSWYFIHGRWYRICR